MRDEAGRVGGDSRLAGGQRELSRRKADLTASVLSFFYYSIGSDMVEKAPGFEQRQPGTASNFPKG